MITVKFVKQDALWNKAANRYYPSFLILISDSVNACTLPQGYDSAEEAEVAASEFAFRMDSLAGNKTGTLYDVLPPHADLPPGPDRLIVRDNRGAENCYVVSVSDSGQAVRLTDDPTKAFWTTYPKIAQDLADMLNMSLADKGVNSQPYMVIEQPTPYNGEQAEAEPKPELVSAKDIGGGIISMEFSAGGNASPLSHKIQAQPCSSGYEGLMGTFYAEIGFTGPRNEKSHVEFLRSATLHPSRKEADAHAIEIVRFLAGLASSDEAEHTEATDRSEVNEKRLSSLYYLATGALQEIAAEIAKKAEVFGAELVMPDEEDVFCSVFSDGPPDKVFHPIPLPQIFVQFKRGKIPRLWEENEEKHRVKWLGLRVAKREDSPVGLQLWLESDKTS